MATQGNAARPTKGPQKNNQQKNSVRFALATAATIVTLFGAQTLAFAGKTSAAQTSDSTTVQAAQVINTTTSADTIIVLPTSIEVVPTSVAVVPTSVPTQAPTATQVATKITTAASQPNPTTKSSR